MEADSPQARCSLCGQSALRDDMFGAEPDLLCEQCADQLRQRLTRTPTGRTVQTVISGRAPVTIAVLAAAAYLFVASHYLIGEIVPPWMIALCGPIASGWEYEQDGRLWWLFTTALFHGGWLHVIFNSFWIWSLGRAIEMTRGSWAFGLVVVGSAVSASALEWIFQGIGIGLSGVVYALAGYLWARRKVDPVAQALMNPSTVRLLVFWFFLCVVLTMSDTWNIGNYAHGGGAVWGIAAGWASTQRRPWQWALLLGLATLGLVAAVHFGVAVR